MDTRSYYKFPLQGICDTPQGHSEGSDIHEELKYGHLSVEVFWVQIAEFTPQSPGTAGYGTTNYLRSSGWPSATMPWTQIRR